MNGRLTILLVFMILFTSGCRPKDITLPYGHYDGDIQNGLPHGIGTLQYDEGLLYTGEWRHGKWHGNGLITLSSGQTLEGPFVDHTYVDEQANIKIQPYPDGGFYVGQIENDTRQGHGTYIYINGDSYTGQYQNDHFHGLGVFKWHTGDYYEGEWFKGLKHGQGKYQFASGRNYVGGFAQGHFDGYGVLTYACGMTRVGYWEAGEYMD